MVQQTLKLLKTGADAHFSDKFRKGNTIFLPDDANVVVSGDLHGNRRNFERITKIADLENSHHTHIVLQEIIHGGPEDDQGGCLSFELLFKAVKLKIQYPDNIHILLGNHDTAFISHSDVMKNGKEMNLSMRNALKRYFGDSAEDIDLEIARLLFAQPLAVKCPNKMMVSHSLPADRFLDQFDVDILDRKLKVNDIVRPQSAYLFTWGRRQSEGTVNKLSEILDIEIFIVGHQAQPDGYCKHLDNMLILASDHNHGRALKFNSSKKYSMDELITNLIPLASIE